MTYCAKDEVLEMIKPGVLNALLGDEYIEAESERLEKISLIVEAAIADAEGEIDGYLAKRYAVPLSPAPKAINKFAKDIAVYNLFSRIGIDEGGEEKNFLNRYQAAIRFLTLVAEGRVSIGTDAADPSAAASAGFSVQASPRIFSRDSLWEM